MIPSTRRTRNTNRKGNPRTEHRVHPTLELLESRRLLAGDVSVEVVDGNLVMRGDRASNQIEVRKISDGTAALAIIGLAGEDGVPTTVNGAERIAVDGVTGDVIAAMYRGDDLIYIHDADLPGAVKIRMGTGNDTVLVGGLPRTGEPVPEPVPADVIDAFFERNAESVDIADPIPVDPVPVVPILPREIANVTVAGSVSIATHGGQDRIGMGSVDVAGNLNIASGSRDDFLTLGLNELPRPAGEDDPNGVDGESTISLPLNVRGNMNLHTGGGADFAWLEALHVGQNLRINLGAGDDALGYDQGRIGGNFSILGSFGDDLIGLAHLVADQIAIRTGHGDDGVGLAAVRAQRLGVGLGTGNDRMRISDSAARIARFHGGSGTDSLEFQGENELHDLAIKSFESIS